MRVFFLTIISLIFISGCTKNGVPLMSSGVSGTEGLPPEQLSFAKFKDIAIPDGAVMDMENTIIFGSDEEWFGRLSINPRLSHAETFDFLDMKCQTFLGKKLPMLDLQVVFYLMKKIKELLQFK